MTIDCPTCRRPLPEVDLEGTLDELVLEAVRRGAVTVPALTRVVGETANPARAELELVRRVVRRLVRGGQLVEGELEARVDGRPGLLARRYALTDAAGSTAARGGTRGARRP